MSEFKFACPVCGQHSKWEIRARIGSEAPTAGNWRILFHTRPGEFAPQREKRQSQSGKRFRPVSKFETQKISRPQRKQPRVEASASDEINDAQQKPASVSGSG